MSGLSILQSTNLASPNDENRSEGRYETSQRPTITTDYNSDDSDAGIQYIAPDGNPSGKLATTMFEFKSLLFL